MNKDIKKVFEKLKYEVTELHYRWTIYREVYAQGPEAIELLNEHGASFFYFSQFLMLDHVSLSFSKLTDPNRQGKNENLSLKQLIVYASDTNDQDFAHELKLKFEELKDNCERFRNLRNKRIAHADLAHGLGEVASPLPGLSREYVEVALNLLRNFMNCFELHYNGSQTIYQELITPLGSGGIDLLDALRDASAYRAQNS